MIQHHETRQAFHFYNLYVFLVFYLEFIPVLGQNLSYIGFMLMKLLAVSDEVIERLYNVRVRQTYPNVKLLLGCGDLPYYYLEFLVSVFDVPLFYVPGNHDPEYGFSPGLHAEGGTNVDERVVFSKGLLMAGLGGSILYGLGGSNQHTQQQMYVRTYKLLLKMMLYKLKYRRPLDILITHSPPAGIHDDTDPTHRGLRALNTFIQIVKPRYMLHGHTMYYKNNLLSHTTRYFNTEVVNVYPFRVMDIEP